MTNIISENNNGKWLERSKEFPDLMSLAVLPDGNGGFMPCPELLTEDEVICFLRIPEISAAKDYSNVIDNLKRMHDLPRIHICGRVLYPRDAIREWIKRKTTNR